MLSTHAQCVLAVLYNILAPGATKERKALGTEDEHTNLLHGKLAPAI